MLLFASAASSQTDVPEGTTEPSGQAIDEATEEPAPESEEAAPGKRVPMPAPTIEEIEVVGRRMQIEVPDPTVSVVGFDPSELKAEGISDIRDLSNFTPSLEIKSAFAATNPTIFIRGVGLDDYNANAAGAVAIYQDGVYMQSPAGQLFQFFDVGGVSVLRGPQPTLYRNAEAGAILVNSRPPSDELEGYVTSTYGNYNLIEVEGAVGGPIVPELLSGRVSATWGIRDGITRNRCAADLRANGRSASNKTCNLSQAGQNPPLIGMGLDPWTNDLDAYAGRGQLLLKLPVGETDTEWLANIHGGKNRSRALQFQHRGVKFQTVGSDEPTLGLGDVSGYKDDDGDPFAGDFNIDGPEKVDLLGSNLRGTWRLGEGYEVRSLTAYEWHERYTVENTDASPKDVLVSEYEDTAWQLSQQLDLAGEWGSLFGSELGDGDWVLGAYYLQETLDVSNFFSSSEGPFPERLTQEYTQKMRYMAAFAQTVHRIRPGCTTFLPCDFTLLGGIRYNREHKDFSTFVCQTGSPLSVCDTLALEGQDNDTWGAPSGEVSLAWDFSEQNNIYAKYSRGWKGGHFNGGAVSIFDVITGIDPETVNSYEGGLRSLWFDGRLMLNVTGFYYDYQDLQVFVIEQTDLGYPIPKLVNASDATVYGVELDLGVEPIDRLNVTYNFAWVESEYNDFEVTFIKHIRPPRPCRTCPPPPPVDRPQTYVYTGNPLIASPRFSMTGSVEYELPLPGTLYGMGLGSLTPRFSFSWKDQIFFDACGGKGTACNFPDGYFGEDPVWVLNATLTWRSEDERFELTGWVQNFLNNYYKVQNFDLSEGIGIILDAYAEPRTFGITATLSF